jgi:RNA polymerase sigma factor (sigma-70 family)
MAKATDNPILQLIRSIAEDHRLKHVPDDDLLRRFISEKNQEAFDCLLRRHGRMVFSVCRAVAGNDADAEDAFQATFLILAQKAKSVRNLPSVGSWLYGVAYRTALKAQAEIAKRQKHEGCAPLSTGREAADDLPWYKVQQIIRAELTALAERYRAPLVLCFLEGRTQDEAARHLGVSKTTVKRRLERGRSLLHARLVGRGFGPLAILAVSAWSAATASARVPPLLASATLKAATAQAVGQTTTGLVSGKVAYLLEKGLQSMFLTKLKIGTVALVACALVPILSGWEYLNQSTMGVGAGNIAKAEPTPKKSRPMIARGSQAQPEAPKNQTLSGRVLEVDGKPAAGAKLRLLSMRPGMRVQPPHIVDLGTSAVDGHFKVTVPKGASDYNTLVVALADGGGFDLIRVTDNIAGAPIELRLVRDNPIQGRLINTEGKPIAGARVSVIDVGVSSENSFDKALTAWKKRYPRIGTPSLEYHLNPSSLLSATTDGDGIFTIRGVGADRLAVLQILGAGLANTVLQVINRDGFDPAPYNQAADDANAFNDFSPKFFLQGPNLAVVIESERIFRGVVKDIDTGKPLTGAKVGLRRDIFELEDLLFPFEGKTDADGRYEIRGARKSKSYLLDVDNNTTTGHVGCRVHVEDKPGYEPISADIGVKKGVIITGRVIDAATKKTLHGIAYVGVLSDNSFAKKYPDVTFRSEGETREADNGMFRLVTLPGPVVLMGGPNFSRKANDISELAYKPAAPDPNYPHYFKSEGADVVFSPPGGGISPVVGNYCKVLALEPDAGVVENDIIVEPATALPVKIQDSQGQPLSGTWVAGIGPRNYQRPIQVDTDSCSAFDLEPGKARLLVFYEPRKKLIGTLALKGDEKTPTIVKLNQPGTTRGQLLGVDDKPLAKVAVELHFHDGTANAIHQFIHHANSFETDAEGRFQIDNVIAGPKFSLSLTQGKRRLEPVIQMEPRPVEPGAVLDFGEIKLKPRAGD